MTERTSGESLDSVFGIDEPNGDADPIYSDSAPGADTFSRSSQIQISAKANAFEAALSRTIESDIIPRLLLAHRTPSSETPAVDPTATGIDEIAALTDILIRESLSTARRFIDAMRGRGVSAESVVADVLPAAARHVGWLWETDACTFVDVTFALSRLQQLLRHYAPSMGAEIPATGGGRRVLLSVMPGEQHTFGISVVEEMLRRGAWDVVPIVPATPADLLRAAKQEWFDIVGLSAAADGSIGSMSALITQLRAASANRSVRIVAGGAAVLRAPEEATAAGADAVVSDPISGMKQMEDMIHAVNHPC